MLFPFHDNNPTTRAPIVTLAIIVINAAVFIWLSTLPELNQVNVVYQHGFVPARIGQLSNRQELKVEVPREVAAGILPAGAPPLVETLRPVPSQIYLSLFTTMFLHGGWLHLLGNMWFLWLFGNNVEDRLGHVPYALFYLGGGLVATFCHWLTGTASVTPVIGASGAIAAMLGAYAVTWPTAKVRCVLFLLVFFLIVQVPALLVLGLWLVEQLLEGANALNLGMDGGVAWWAHIGGFAMGAVCMPLLGLVFGKRIDPWHEPDGSHQVGPWR